MNKFLLMNLDCVVTGFFKISCAPISVSYCIHIVLCI